AVISGSVALHFFTQDCSWTPKDLDIYVPDNTFEAFVEGLQVRPLLAFSLLSDIPPSGPPLPEQVANGIKEVQIFATRTGRRVDVIRSPVCTPIYPLLFYWTTLVMNFITPGGCFCGYPVETLNRRATV
ncbi:hypothetical protein C8Q76DRAFT_586729, partial [Earliella scabrosa]